MDNQITSCTLLGEDGIPWITSFQTTADWSSLKLARQSSAEEFSDLTGLSVNWFLPIIKGSAEAEEQILQ